MADGIHSASDIVASIAVLLGLRLSQRKSKHFPYGLYKVENIIAIVSAMAIFFAGYEIVKEVVFQSGQRPGEEELLSSRSPERAHYQPDEDALSGLHTFIVPFPRALPWG